MKREHCFVGHATDNSPLRKIFSNGMIPITAIHPRDSILGPDKTEAKVYLLDVRACEEDELERIAQFIAPQFDAGIAEAREYLAHVDEFPIREDNISGVSFPLRYAQ